MVEGGVPVGVIGAGNVSHVYLGTAARFPVLDVVAVADLDLEKARAVAQKFGVPHACSVEELLSDPRIELVANLTVPSAHGTVGMAVVEASKALYNEKPLTTTREEAQLLLRAADARGVRVGGAPDTFLGGSIQACRELIDAGAIGEPIGATAVTVRAGPESWHPNPGFFYQQGAGPLFDLGPYYITCLVTLLGPIRSVTGSARITFSERAIKVGPMKGSSIPVDTPTYVTATLEFATGLIATLITTFDVVVSDLPHVEIYGSEGTVNLVDPTIFGGRVGVSRGPDEGWRAVRPRHRFTRAEDRGIGLAEMAFAMRAGRPHRAGRELAYHVLDVMSAIYDSAQSGRRVDIVSTCDRPAPIAPEWPADERNGDVAAPPPSAAAATATAGG
ncbi:MAG: Gfo/Idh/MocA family oxidoreductase [Chloroflexota bacterium]|nr:Gfo/Idh/MocA family oxidoreductase [Chloroflexota bacterium]